MKTLNLIYLEVRYFLLLLKRIPDVVIKWVGRSLSVRRVVCANSGKVKPKCYKIEIYPHLPINTNFGLTQPGIAYTCKLWPTTLVLPTTTSGQVGGGNRLMGLDKSKLIDRSRWWWCDATRSLEICLFTLVYAPWNDCGGFIERLFETLPTFYAVY